MALDLPRRGFLIGLGAALVAAPAVVRAASLMPIHGILRRMRTLAYHHNTNGRWEAAEEMALLADTELHDFRPTSMKPGTYWFANAEHGGPEGYSISRGGVFMDDCAAMWEPKRGGPLFGEIRSDPIAYRSPGLLSIGGGIGLDSSRI